MRLAFFLLLVTAAPLCAQDLPDPGRRLTKEELEADPEKPQPAKPPATASRGEHPRDPQACERARRNYQIFCGMPNTYRSRSFECAEAYAFYRQSC